MFTAHKHLEVKLGRQVGQAELAEMIGKAAHEPPPDQTTVGRWFKDTLPRSIATIAAIAKVYGVSAGWLTYGEGDMLPPAERNERRA